MVAQERLIEKVNHGHGVLELRLNRARALNAFTANMYLRLADEINQLGSRTDVRIILLTGRGKTFCAGMDVREASEAEDIRQITSAARTFMQALMNSPHILIAAVFGHVVGIGVTMLLHCDLVIAHTTTSFETPFASVGIVPEYASSFLFPYFLGTSLTYRLLLRGESINAKEMKQAGVIQTVHTDVDAAALGHALSWSQSLNDEQWKLIEKSKFLIRKHIREASIKAINLEFHAIAEAHDSGLSRPLMVRKVNQLSSRRSKL